MNQGEGEWVFEVFIKLPMGFRIIKLKEKFNHLKYAKWALHRKIEKPIGTFREKVYWTSKEPK